ncbi:proteoglycan 4b [Halichoeres trimaculatus]|uniref:proteoglycan 4b n=1 Tax=Halichoeres trimaculatus TaxID=147232 RepID=UPI003D9DCAF3
MSSTTFCAAVLLLCTLTFSAAQTSCKGRCGAEYYRGYICQCDYTCLSYGECCKDFEARCTTRDSCQGRCGESFKRGRLCSCDADCVKYKQCCSDYNKHCDAAEPPVSGAADQSSTFSEGDNADDHLIPQVSPTTDPQDALGDDIFGDIFPDDDFSDNDPMDPGVTPIPESTSGYGSDQLSAEPTQNPNVAGIKEAVTEASQTQTTISQDEPTQASDSPNTPSLITEAVSTNSPEVNDPTTPGTTPPTPTTAAVSSKPSSPVQPPRGDSPDPNSPDPDTDVPSKGDVSPDPSIPEPKTEVPPNSGVSPDPNIPELKTEVPPESGVSPDPNVPEPKTEVPPDSGVSPDPNIPEPKTEVPPEGDVSPDPNIPEPETEVPPDSGVSPGAQNADPTVISSDRPDVTTAPTSSPTELSVSTKPTKDSSADSTSPVTSALDTTPSPTATMSVPRPDDATTVANPTVAPSSLPELGDSLASVSPTDSSLPAEPDATNIPTATASEQDDATVDVPLEGTTADPLNLTPVPTKPRETETTSKPQVKPEVFKPLPVPVKPALNRPSTKPEAKPLDTHQTLDDPRDYQADDSNDTNLCSGRPVSGVTTLRNGTIVVFRGHFFWFLDRNRVPGPARGITQVWGVPSPIDTVFTRCNCQGKTYIFKGSQYWRFENDALDPGYPMAVETGFDGLRGHMTAALSVPQYQRRRESVYFFKRGGTVQKYSYQFGTSPKCGRKPQYAIYTVKNRVVRQAVSALGPTINIRTSWRGFPSTITSAISVPSPREPEGYKYYVFSRSKSYKVRMDGERPAITASTANTSPQSNNIFKCPKKV